MNEELQNPEYTVRVRRNGSGKGPVPVWIYFLAISGIVGLAIFGWRQWDRFDQARRAEAQKKAAPAAPVVEDPLAATYLGRIKAKKTIQIAAPLEGTMEGVEVADGQDVFEGQLLGRIRNSSLAAAKEKAEIDLASTRSKVTDLESQILAARLEASRAAADAVRLRGEADVAAKQLERQSMLYKEGATARKLYEAAQEQFQRLTEERKTAEETARRSDMALRATVNSLEEAKRRLKEREGDLEDADAEILTGDIHSPADGILIAHKRNSGEDVTREIQDLFEIATDLTELEIAVEFPPALAGKLAAGQPALLTIAEAGAAPLSGKVREVKGNIALVDFTPPTPAIRPGLTARVRFLNAPN